MGSCSISESGQLIGLIAPLRVEARTASVLRKADWQVLCAGYGTARARYAANKLIAAGAKRLLVWGTAGGLDPSLPEGSIVLPKDASDEYGNVWAIDENWHDWLVRALEPRACLSRERVITVTSPVATPTEKKLLHESSGAVAADMESAAVLEVGRSCGVPSAVLRVIADTAVDALPGAVVRAKSQRFLAAEVLLRALMHPTDFSQLMRLAHGLGAAREVLKACAFNISNFKALEEPE